MHESYTNAGRTGTSVWLRSKVKKVHVKIYGAKQLSMFHTDKKKMVKVRAFFMR